MIVGLKQINLYIFVNVFIINFLFQLSMEKITKGVISILILGGLFTFNKLK